MKTISKSLFKKAAIIAFMALLAHSGMAQQGVPGKGVFEFGQGMTKEQHAGKIGYQTFSGNALDIVGAGTNSGNRKVQVYAEGGFTLIGGIAGKNVIEFGRGILKEQHAGKIGYQTFSGNALDIVGAGTKSDNRKVQIYAEGGLSIRGSVHANTYSAVTPPWSDFVFEEDYNLRSLESVENYIKENKHLPDVPSEIELQETGLNLPEMDAKLLQKIEELTLYIIEQNKRIGELEAKVSEQSKE